MSFKNHKIVEALQNGLQPESKDEGNLIKKI